MLAYVDGLLQFPKTREGDFPTKDEKCLASNEMTCVLPLSPIYTITSFATAKDIWDYISLILRVDDSPSFHQLQHEEHALAYGKKKERKEVCYTIYYYRRLRLLWDQLNMRDPFQR